MEVGTRYPGSFFDHQQLFTVRNNRTFSLCRYPFRTRWFTSPSTACCYRVHRFRWDKDKDTITVAARIKASIVFNLNRMLSFPCRTLSFSSASETLIGSPDSAASFDRILRRSVEFLRLHLHRSKLFHLDVELIFIFALPRFLHQFQLFLHTPVGKVEYVENKCSENAMMTKFCGPWWNGSSICRISRRAMSWESALLSCVGAKRAFPCPCQYRHGFSTLKTRVPSEVCVTL